MILVEPSLGAAIAMGHVVNHLKAEDCTQSVIAALIANYACKGNLEQKSICLCCLFKIEQYHGLVGEYFCEFDNDDDVACIITLCWAIWGARNTRIMESKSYELEDTVKYAMKICQEVCEESSKLEFTLGRTAPVSHPATWSAPD